MSGQEFSIFFYFLLDMTLYLISLQQHRNTSDLAHRMTLW
jgi:hypothetical protein